MSGANSPAIIVKTIRATISFLIILEAQFNECMKTIILFNLFPSKRDNYTFSGSQKTSSNKLLQSKSSKHCSQRPGLCAGPAWCKTLCCTQLFDTKIVTVFFGNFREFVQCVWNKSLI